MAEYNLGENLGLPEIPKTSIMQYREPYLDLFQIFIAIRRLAAYVTGTYVPEAPKDGKQYGRKDGAWTQVVVQEAPIDTKIYGRKDGAWTEVTSGGGGARYAPGYIYAAWPNWWTYSATGTQAFGAATAGIIGHVVFIDGTGSFKIALNCTSIGSGVTYRVGLYNFRSGTWNPGTLAVDMGTLTVSALGIASTATAMNVPAGTYALLLFYSTTTTCQVTQRTVNSTVQFAARHPSLYATGTLYPSRIRISPFTYPTGTLPDLTTATVVLDVGDQLVQGELLAA